MIDVILICSRILLLVFSCYCNDLEPASLDSNQRITDPRARVETRNINEDYTFEVWSGVEYYIKFVLTDSVADELAKTITKQIFQVNSRIGETTESTVTDLHESVTGIEDFVTDVDETDNRLLINPVDITVRQFNRIISFQLPATERRGNSIVYRSNEKSVDFCPTSDINSNSTVLMTLSTSSHKPVLVHIKVLLKGKTAGWNRTKTGVYESSTSITPVTTRIRYFQPNLLPPGYINIKVSMREDSDCLCSLISIQNPTCPFHDDIGSAMRFGKWNTMLNTSTIIIDTRDYPDGFIIVLVASATDDLCNIYEQENRCSNYNRNTTITPKKRVLIEIQENAKAETYTNATLTISSLYIGIMLTTLFFSFLEFKYKYSDFETIRGTLEEKIELYTHVGREKMHKISESIGRKISADHHNVQDGFHVTDAIKQTIEAVINPGSPIRKDAIISVEKEDLDKRVSLFIDDEVNFEEKEKVINPGEKVEQKFEESEQKADENQEEELIVKKKIQFTYSKVATPVEMKGLLGTDEDVEERRRRRLDTDLKVSHLSMKLEDPLRSKSVYQKSNLYLGILLLISIFYSLPVLQMVFAFSHSQRITGNQDICYYNDLCRRPLGVIRDFNHVFSNLGYCVFGILFMLIVYLKKWKYTTFFQDNKTIQEVEYGVPQQYGIYFSMGLALFMEGVMSGSYHVCPTNITFQFDTTFMYLMCILMFLKLYQVRHADVSANAVGVFFGLGVSLILETVSIFYSGPWFWAFFCTVYMIVILVAMVHAYNLGVVKYDYKIFYNVAYILVIEVKKILSRSPGDPILPRIRSRLICLLVMGFVNICLCLYFGITGTPGASNYLLAIFILNLMMYFIYYCSMKIICGEKINKVPTLYSVLSFTCTIPALYYFTQKEKSTEISPSESRMLNRECIFMDFFDGHDIWHFLGGSGLFFSFLTIFTIDEDLKYKQRNSIHVF